MRHHVYRVFVERGAPPSVAESARQLGVAEEGMRASYQRLHDAHAILLQPDTFDIRMANPLSAIPTAYRAIVNGRTLYANCAWDSVGIPAMLRADARIESVYSSADGPTPARYAIVAGELRGDAGLVHFPLPFKRWYDDQIHT